MRATEFKNKTLYFRSGNSKLLVWFIGGSFIFSQRDQVYGFLNKLFDKIGHEFDILTFQYPVRFKYTLQQSMLAINDILKDYILQYDEHYAGSMSAGTLLLGAFCQKEKSVKVAKDIGVPQIGLQFKKLISICGLFEPEFNSSLLNGIFNFYIARGTPGIKYYSFYNLSPDKLVIGSVSDFLYQQTLKFISTEKCTFRIFTNPQLGHVFCKLLNYAESLDTIDMISKFLV